MAHITIVNPKRRKAKTHRNPKRRRKHHKKNPIFGFAKKRRRHRSKRRMFRNPINLRGATSSIRSTVPAVLKPAAVAALGALSLDFIWGYLPIPTSIKAGTHRHLAKGLGAVGLTLIVAKVAGRDTAMKVGIGAMTVVIWSALRDLMAAKLPAVRLDGYPALSYVTSAQQVGRLGMYTDQPGAGGSISPMGYEVLGLTGDDSGDDYDSASLGMFTDT